MLGDHGVDHQRGKMTGKIRSGVGGWTFEPWRGTFFPPGTVHTKELDYASRQFPAIEVNGTYYSSQKPATFAKWAASTPDDFIFTLKASRFCTNRKVLAEAGESIGKFLGQGISELGVKLGPILWQFMPTKKFDQDDFDGFLKLLPEKLGALPLRHAVEVRHDSFCTPEFIALCRKHNVAVVFADHDKYPPIPDVTADFIYARLQTAKKEHENGYTDGELDRWAGIAKSWAEGHQSSELDLISTVEPPHTPRDVYVFMISGDKEKNPAAAKAFLARL
jgi:uncharacterized protein YecE (DUF72 family)